MKTIEKYLIKKIRHMSGNVITIGCSDALLDEINKNNNILNCNVLNNMSRTSGKYTSAGRMKRINIKKFKRKFKKKKTDYMIVDIQDVLPYAKRFVSSSVYITKGELYIYTNEVNDKVDEMINKYQRFHTKVEKITNEDGCVYKIDCTNGKVKRLQEIKYLWKDTIDNIIDLIGDYLIN